MFKVTYKNDGSSKYNEYNTVTNEPASVNIPFTVSSIEAMLDETTGKINLDEKVNITVTYKDNGEKVNFNRTVFPVKAMKSLYSVKFDDMSLILAEMYYGKTVYFVNVDGVQVVFGVVNAFSYYAAVEVIEVSRKYTPKTTQKRGSSSKHSGNAAVKIEKQAPAEIIKKEEENNSGEIKHEKYNQIAACLSVDIPVYLAGPAGCGKNYTVEQICNEKEWGFYFSNAVQQEYKLTGFVDANGIYHETEFYKACTSENECVFFLDEMDASIPDVLVLLNAAIANGYFEFPTGRVNLDNVHFVAAGNTMGNGADEQYTGRMVLDQATLDRFAIIQFGYDKRVEMGISENNSELVEYVHALRDKAEENGVRATFSYRCLSMVTELEKVGLELTAIIQIAIFKGLDDDTVKSLAVEIAGNKYSIAYKKAYK